MISRKKLKDKSKEEIDKILAEAFLNVYVDDNKLINPLDWPSSLDENPHYHIAYIMSQPEYFYFICKHIFNVEILPIQGVILQEMWRKRFPMLIASRGFGKLLPSDTNVRVNNGWKKIKDIIIGEKVYGSDGKLCNVTDKTSLQTDVEMYRITFRDGRTIECCEDHQWKVWDKNKNSNTKNNWSVLKTKDMKDNFYWNRVGEKSNGIEYRYAVPVNELIDETEVELPIHPYILGVILGDGCITESNTIITSQDIEIIRKCEKLLPDGYKINKLKKKYDYSIVKTGNNKPFHYLLKDLGLHGKSSKDKFIPDIYKFNSYNNKLELIKGLMDTDGYSNINTIEYYTISNQLSADFLDVIRSIGIACKHSIKKSFYKGKRYNDCNRISIYTDQPIFSLSRKLNYINHTKSKQGQSKYEKVFITNIEYIGKGSGYCISVDSYDNTYITKDYIVTHNSFSLAIYSLLRALLLPKRKILIAGAAFRQSKVIFNYCETIWDRSPLFRDICNAYGSDSGPHHNPDMFYFNIGSSKITAVPVGPGGDKIRGQRAHDLISDEFNSIPKEVFETVMVGFAAVSSDPTKNVKEIAKKKLAAKLGIELEDEVGELIVPNQIITSGTAGYTFEQFYEYWQDWHDIISSKGNPELLERYINKKRQSSDMSVDDIIQNLNYKDYSIIRIPFEIIPDGFMDKAQVIRSKATMHSSTYLCEYGASFPDDSQGFFKRSLINKCTCGPERKITHEGYDNINFAASLKGGPYEYVMGIDPASESDNFAIVILELHKNHRRVVYGWTTNKKQQKEEIAKGLTDEHDYYAYCVLKIRELMKRFNIIRIVLDPEGGGRGIREGLMNERLIGPGEQRILEIIEDGKDKDTDILEGLHILQMAQFSTATWLAEANHGLRADLEQRILLFPYFDTIALAIAEGQDLLNKRVYHTLEYVMEEIEELKNELTTITITKTATNRDRWDTPDCQMPGGKKGKQRKDRYSALLIANMVARQMMNNISFSFEGSIGGAAEQNNNYEGPLFTGNEEYNKKAALFYNYLG